MALVLPTPNFGEYAQYQPKGALESALQGANEGITNVQNVQQRSQNLQTGNLRQQQIQQQLEEQPQQFALQQKLLQTKLAEEPKAFAASQALKAAQIEHLKSAFSNLSGPAAQAASLQAYLQQYPATTPQGKMALDAWNAMVGEKKARANFYNANYWLKNSTPLQRSQFNQNYQSYNAQRQQQGLAPVSEQQYAAIGGFIPSSENAKKDVVTTHVQEIQGMQGAQGAPIQSHQTIVKQLKQGISPQQIVTNASSAVVQSPMNTQTPAMASMPSQVSAISPEPYGQEASQTGLSIQRQTSDPQNRSKILYGTQAEQTIKNINNDINDFLSYSGPQGMLRLKKDHAASLVGKAPKSYLAFKRAATNLILLNGQVRQYYGDSIQPKAKAELSALTNPNTWLTSPQVAAEKWKAFIKTLNQEIGIRRKAMQNPSIYTKGLTEQNQPKSYSDDDWNLTAKKYGMTVPQLKAYVRKMRGK